MPSYSSLWPDSEQLESYRVHLKSLSLPEKIQIHLLYVARSLVRHIGSEPDRVRSWIRKQVDRISFRQACRHIAGARKFLDRKSVV